jgi:leucine dehydrogenase
MGGLTRSVGGDPSPYTARGVFNGMKACIDHLGKPADFHGLTVAIQGVGHVGYNLASILHDAGAKLIVADINQASVDRCVREFDAKAVGSDEILAVPCDILAPCALGKVIDANNAQSLRCSIVCGAANNILGDPDEDGVTLKSAGVLYAPDFVVNAGGLIQLAGLYLKMTQEELDQKNAQIETTTAQILRESASLPSTHAAAVAYARRIAYQTSHRPEQVHAG